MTDSRLEKHVRTLRPEGLLDVGCGCGHFTRKLAQAGGQVIAIDVARGEPGWQDIGAASNVHFCRMNGSALGFASESFPVVLERGTLHHIARWPEVLAEMIRVSSNHVILEEPLDDLRSAAKQRTFEAQGLFLALQAEVDYAHYRHLDRDALISALGSHTVLLEVHVERSDAPRSFDEYFHAFGEFAARSAREAYWWDRLENLRSRFDGAPLCEDDILTLLAAKRTQVSST